MLGGELRLDLLVLDDPPGRRVGQEDPARLQPALADDGGRVDVQHANLAGQHDQAVAGHPVTAGPQAVAVQHRPDHRSVGERDQRGPVPRLHQGRVETVEGPQRRIHLLVVLPRLRDHHQHRVRERPPAHVQQFQAGVEARRVARRLVQDRQQPLESPAVGVALDEIGVQQCLARPHPVAVAADRVDLAVVRGVPVRVGQRPGREGVGGEPGMHQGQGRGVPGIGQVRVEPLKLERGEHPLVDDRRRGQAHEVRPGLVLRPLAQAERPPVEGHPAAAGQRCDEQLGQMRQHGARARTAVRGVVRNVAPAQHGQALERGDPLDRGHRGGPAGSVAGQEHHPGRVAARIRQPESAGVAEHLVGDLGQDPGPIAGFRVAALRSPVIQVPQHGEGLGHDLVAAATGQVRHEADAAGVVLVTAVVETLDSGGCSRRHQYSCRPVRHRVWTCGSGRHWPCGQPGESASCSRLVPIVTGMCPATRSPRSEP